ncbi:lipopolysaccharide/colanic/teichoic acid biosynthesis glycosyltransferase [Hydrogenispora ethanolica]|uniref:Lipopolysaccharide/colanic/teichoic acid biosynthesis glycosyltransferase n=1 Tax=Hydrogenispora ethanolica TaxID=1082276 RepID=A0A4R1R8V2_HYDET|nr:sugar transferase [Hydrogenispora ethanolica]TCL61812.1 lipopolysaccharide/colanic/teichoic acid biosynthesis glycosyltransferase [Hydrogenispora ethanolica]
MMRRVQFSLKHGLDFLMALVLLLPVALFVSILGLILYLDSPGPIFFRQLRPGRGGKLFGLYKLRTMTPGDHTAATPRNRDGSLALTSDLGGYTRFGRVLRRFSLDELPQLFNILKGEMSFIGPRPDLPEHLELYTEEERLKLAVKPGLTGLAQVMGRNELPWKERLQLDITYVRKYSLLLDLKIFLLTLSRLISGRGVYQ